MKWLDQIQDSSEDCKNLLLWLTQQTASQSKSNFSSAISTGNLRLAEFSPKSWDLADQPEEIRAAHTWVCTGKRQKGGEESPKPTRK